MTAPAPGRYELAQAQSGYWVILRYYQGAPTAIPTLAVDLALAERDLASWRETGELSAESRAWFNCAKAMMDGTRSRHRRGISGQTLTKVEALRLLMAQGYRCALTGLPLDPYIRGPWQPSIDRIESSKGYTPDNIRVVCYIANMALHNWGEEPVLKLAQALVTRGSRPDAKAGHNLQN